MLQVNFFILQFHRLWKQLNSMDLTWRLWLLHTWQFIFVQILHIVQITIYLFVFLMQIFNIFCFLNVINQKHMQFSSYFSFSRTLCGLCISNTWHYPAKIHTSSVIMFLSRLYSTLRAKKKQPNNFPFSLSVCMITPGGQIIPSWRLSFIICCSRENLGRGTKLPDKYAEDISWSGATSPLSLRLSLCDLEWTLKGHHLSWERPSEIISRN